MAIPTRCEIFHNRQNIISRVPPRNRTYLHAIVAIPCQRFRSAQARAHRRQEADLTQSIPSDSIK